jgi:integrase
VLDRVIAVNPCPGVRLPAKTRTGRVLPLTVEQVRAIATAAADPYAAMVRVAAATGMRSGELRALTVDRISPALHLLGDLTPQQATLTVDRSLTDALTFGPTKTAAGVRTITVGPSTVAILRDHLAAAGVGPDGLVFHADGGPISRQRAGHAWRAATSGMTVRARSGWHDLRHHHASLLIASGLSVRAVAARLGHADPSDTLRIYSHLWPTDEDRAVDAIEATYG